MAKRSSEACCGVEVIRTIVGSDTVVRNQSLKAYILQQGIPEQEYNTKGTPISALLGLLAQYSWHHMAETSHRGERGFCGDAISGAGAYLLNVRSKHWSALRLDPQTLTWQLSDGGKRTLVSDVGETIQGWPPV